MDDRLSFEAHVHAMCKKAGRQINAIARIAKSLDAMCKNVLYDCFIQSNFQYCANVWHFGHTSNIWRLENVNKRALRVISNDYVSSYPELLKKAEKTSIFVQNIKLILIEFYKYVYGLNPDILAETFKMSNHRYDTRGLLKVLQPKVHTETHGINSFRYQAPKLWNLLPDDIKSASTLTDFKKKIKAWEGPICTCGYCLLCKMYLV